MENSVERRYQIHPIVQDSVMHNTRVLSNLRSLGATLFGVSAGILGLESYLGFIYYTVCYIILTLLFFFFRVFLPAAGEAAAAAAAIDSPSSFVEPEEQDEQEKGKRRRALDAVRSGSQRALRRQAGNMLDTSLYSRSALEFWTGEFFGGLPGYILTWTLFYGIVKV